MPTSVRCYALVPCAGVGARAGSSGLKQYTVLAGTAVVAHTLAALARVQRLTATLVVLAPNDTQFESAMPALDAQRVWLARCGGATRAASVAAGLRVLIDRGADPGDWVLVHDAARCLLQPAWIDRLLDACWDDAVGGLLALPLADTLKQADDDTPVRSRQTLDRDRKWLAQTPQMFRVGALQRALEAAAAGGHAITDEAGAVEAMGLRPRLVPGEFENFKLTWPADFALAERLLRTRAAAAP